MDLVQEVDLEVVQDQVADMVLQIDHSIHNLLLHVVMGFYEMRWAIVLNQMLIEW